MSIYNINAYSKNIARVFDMEKLLSNSWVISIVSGIIVFIITNLFINIKNGRKYKKLIYDANTMILNHLRGYVVDNGLPKTEVIEAVKSSIAREYAVKCEELLNVKSICEELVKDIIGNNYISNENKKRYIEMLQNHLEQNSNIEQHIPNDNQNYKTKFDYLSTIISLIAGIFTVIGSVVATYIDNNIKSLQINPMQSIIIILLTVIVCVVIYIKCRKN